MLRKLVFLSLLLAYSWIFFMQEYFAQLSKPQLAFPLPAMAEKSLLGYLRQLGGEMHFIQSAVYAGSLAFGECHMFGADRVAANLDSAAELNPPFIDTYFYCESFIATQGPEYARQANSILRKGVAALPEKWELPFFLGFNHFYYLHEYSEAANALKMASKAPGAPSWLGHLASVLAAKSGNIYAGLIWLKAMHAGEKDEAVKRSYENDIADFETALEVQKSIFSFRKTYGHAPFTLDELIPEFLRGIPVFKGNYRLKWDPPVLSMERTGRSISKRDD